MTRTLPTPGKDWALFLDVDGTLLDIAARPDAVEVPGELCRSLKVLDTSLGHAVALVSGRSIANLDRIFAPLVLPAAGQHGAELRLSASSAIVASAPSPQLPAVSERLRRFASARPGVIVEDKGRSIAVHFRAADCDRGDLYRVARRAVRESGGELELLPAREALDVRPRSTNKGLAVERFMRSAPFLGRVPVFVGDDLTDEDGFRAANRFSGHAIRVGRGGKSLARWRLAAPAEVRQWLAEVAAALAEE
ncbi:MAG: trehalose-phosphatase [Alphaproteobacteria bacterium]